MEKARLLLITGVIAASAAAITIFVQRSRVPPAGSSANEYARMSTPAKGDEPVGHTASATASVVASNPVMDHPPGTPSIHPREQSNAGSAVDSAPTKTFYQPGPKKFRDAHEPLARVALSGVGRDFEAEAQWLRAINDPSLPAKERKDLIEDLNEDGISDPKRPALGDLPIIESRIQLIEKLLPSAMDSVNADAFREAQKDLIQMRDRLKK